MAQSIVWLINLIVKLITLLVIIHVFIAYFLTPYHPIRQTLDRIVETMLRPIRKIIPPLGMLDLSPLILLIILQLSGWIITMLLTSLIN